LQCTAQRCDVPWRPPKTITEFGGQQRTNRLAGCAPGVPKSIRNTQDEARHLIVEGINYAACRETDSSLQDADKNRLFGSEHYSSGRIVTKPSQWAEGDFEEKMATLLRCANALNRSVLAIPSLLVPCCHGKQSEDYVTREDGSRVRDFRVVWEGLLCLRTGTNDLPRVSRGRWIRVDAALSAP
jgi:hypothetical protein